MTMIPKFFLDFEISTSNRLKFLADGGYVIESPEKRLFWTPEGRTFWPPDGQKLQPAFSQPNKTRGGSNFLGDLLWV